LKIAMYEESAYKSICGEGRRVLNHDVSKLRRYLMKKKPREYGKQKEKEAAKSPIPCSKKIARRRQALEVHGNVVRKHGA
jgi:hypothetical protein